MKKVPDREGFKTCPRCKLELALNVTNFGFHSVTRKPTSYCRKCSCAKAKTASYTKPYVEANCKGCGELFVYPGLKKNDDVFCSTKCNSDHQKDN